MGALAKISDQTLAELDSITASEMVQVSPDAAKKFSTALTIGTQINRIRNLLTPEVMNQVVMPLKDCGSLGFVTDESQRSQSYNIDQIRNCVTEALLRGAQLVGAEFMIFQGRTFFTKPYFERKVRTFPGLTNLDIVCSTPRMLQGGAVVEATATFELNGKPQKIERVGSNAIAVRLQGNSGSDSALGKAEKRLLRFVLNFITGYAPPSEPEDAEEASMKVATGVEVVESAQIVSDSTPPQTPEKTEPAASPVSSTSGNEAAKSAIKRTVKPKKNAEPAPLPPPPPAPEPESETEQDQGEQAPEENLESEGELQEEAPATATEQEAAIKVEKFTVAKKDPDTQVPTLVRVITNAGEFFVKTKEDAASIGAITKANGGNVMIKFADSSEGRMITAWAAPVKK